MRNPLFLALVIAMCGLFGRTADAQSYPVKACDPPKEPLGVIHGAGMLVLRLNNAGKADTSSLQILDVRGISVGGMRSAAARQLAACRFDRSTDMLDGDRIVITGIRFDSATTIVTPATPATGNEKLMAIPARFMPPTDPIDATDSTLEERPRRISCNRPPDPPPFTGNYRSRQDADAAFASWQRRYTGTANARVTVDPDGHVPPNGVVIVSSTNPSMHQTFAGVLSTCLFVPGRIGGVAVWTVVATKTGIGNVGGLP